TRFSRDWSSDVCLPIFEPDTSTTIMMEMPLRLMRVSFWAERGPARATAMPAAASASSAAGTQARRVRQLRARAGRSWNDENTTRDRKRDGEGRGVALGR